MNTPGERDLATLLRTLRPALDPDRWTFCSVAPNALTAPLLHAARAVVREEEGVTLVLTPETAAASGLRGAGEWAQITLRAHSSLEAVGMIAAVASALAAEGISVNPVAGFHHDHLFVPWPERDRAVDVLTRAFR